MLPAIGGPVPPVAMPSEWPKHSRGRSIFGAGVVYTVESLVSMKSEVFLILKKIITIYLLAQQKNRSKLLQNHHLS